VNSEGLAKKRETRRAAEEIAELALYLASDESSFTTGQTHIIDGGGSI